MANPSLQIGNSNWAIKEDNLLGYSTAGTRFVPQPITMTRASAGTRVNSSGLVETVELLGSEEITNEDFTQLPLGTGWDAYSSGTSTVAFTEGAVLSIDGSNSNVGVYQQNIFTSGVQYKIVVSVKATASFDALVSETDAASSKGTIGTLNLTTSYQDFSFYYTGTGAWDLFIHRKYGETAGQNQQIYVKSVSVKESTKNNLARVDYDGTASSLLVEPQRTNLIPYSEDFSDSSWTKTGSVSVSSNSVISPDGTLNGSTITGLTGSGSNDLRFGTSINPASTTYTSSVYLKGSGTIRMQMSNNVDNAGSETITLSSSWVRYDLTHTFNSTTGSLALTLDDSGGTATTYDIWGAQLEEGSYATSYIPTSGSTVTRNQDQYSKTGISNLINSEEGSFFVDISALNASPGSQLSISLSGDNSNDRVLIYTGSGGGEWICQFRKDSTTIVTVKRNTTVTNQSKVAVSWKSGKYLMYIDGDKATTYSVGSETTSTTFEVDDLKNLQFSPNHNSTSNLFYGKVKQLQVFKTW